MRLTGFTKYGLLVLVYATVHRDELLTVNQISVAIGISRNHLTKIVHTLGRAGYLRTSRGRAGGLRLGRPAVLITVGEVVRTMEQDLDVAERFDTEHGTSATIAACGLRSTFWAATRAYFDVLDRCTLADLASDHGELTDLLIGRPVNHTPMQQPST